MGENLRKGFVSALVGALAIVVIAAAVGVHIADSSARDAQLLRLENSKLFYRHNDARDFLYNATTDALLDSSFAACGCASNAPTTLAANFSYRLTNYFINATKSLNDSLINANYSALSLSSLSVSSCNSTTNYTLNYTIETNSTHSRKSTAVVDARNFTLYKNSSALAFNNSLNNYTILYAIVTC